ncbi:Flp family type IVb pilin [Mesorhizobium sp. SP-1A]|uniref:Flp family type IVb pilin n=1 Tax=Mesorhizobium sp. SP-1A TaxID=3077840 RepID=UPI0028F6D0C7|nr:Flp family type IVb pilin [Mesorhizobium sp. SP-1A]
MTLLKRFLKDEHGATAVEYGLILAVITLTIVGGVGKVGDAIGWLWGSNESRLSQALSMHE